ncbi:MAG TPA: chromate resistance protein ChrB domain-containing protein [Caldimonas sp.]
MTDWLVLAAALPTAPSGLRVRIWRALRATGCATLRDGVYILPAQAATAADLRTIHQAIRDGGADAHLLELQARDAAQEKAFRRLFDRSEQYADFARSLKDARATVKTSAEPALRKLLRSLDQQLTALRSIDFFPGKAQGGASRGFDTLRVEIGRRLSPGEPGRSAAELKRLPKDAFHGKTWATRKRPWVDRLATAWLVRRCLDAKARFLWLDDPKKCPKSAIGFDFDGARFTHVGDRVTFEVVAHSFGLDDDPAIQRLGELVHFIDVGGIPVDPAAGVETVLRGLQARHADDDALLAAACDVFDALHAALRLAE